MNPDRPNCRSCEREDGLECELKGADPAYYLAAGPAPIQWLPTRLCNACADVVQANGWEVRRVIHL